MLPARNRWDYDDIPEGARNQLEFIWLDRVEESDSRRASTRDGGGAAVTDGRSRRRLGTPGRFSLLPSCYALQGWVLARRRWQSGVWAPAEALAR